MTQRTRCQTGLHILVAGTCLMVLPLQSAVEESGLVEFEVAGAEFTFRLPAGDCLPTGGVEDFALAVASADRVNVTHFTSVACETAANLSDSLPTRWAMFKTPRRSIGKRVPSRSALITSIKSRAGDLKLQDGDWDVAEKTFQEVFGVHAKVSGHMEAIYVDDYAGYVGGTIKVAQGSSESLVAAVFAMTEVRGRLFSCNRYAEYVGMATIIKLLEEVKTNIRRFVEGNE